MLLPKTIASLGSTVAPLPIFSSHRSALLGFRVSPAMIAASLAEIPPRRYRSHSALS
jgi:hypothetical protein